jgi:hypothetical protein
MHLQQNFSAGKKYCVLYYNEMFVPSYFNLEASNSTTTVGEIRPGVPQPVCPDRPLARHLMCGCCLKPMPIQENFPPLPGGEPYAKSQKCKSYRDPHTRIYCRNRSAKVGVWKKESLYLIHVKSAFSSGHLFSREQAKSECDLVWRCRQPIKHTYHIWLLQRGLSSENSRKDASCTNLIVSFT